MSQVATDIAALSPKWDAETTVVDHALAETVVSTRSTTYSRVSDRADAVSTSVSVSDQTPIVAPCPRWKRTIDIVGAASSMLILSPFFLLIATYIKCVSRGPVLFRQTRYGLEGRPFKVWKFRTIEVSHDGDDHHEHVSDLMESDRPLEKRDHMLDVIPGGSWLRDFGIDELPQLINVLKGEMSLVGPRPDVVPADRYERWYQRRFDVLPGITGLWQVRGKNRTTFRQMMCLDVAYVRRRSLLLDVAILIWTIPAVVLD